MMLLNGRRVSAAVWKIARRINRYAGIEELLYANLDLLTD